MAVAVAISTVTIACRDEESAGELHAELAVLEREVAGLRRAVEKVGRGQPILPHDAVVAGISDALLRDFLKAQLPVDVETHDLVVSLTDAEVTFKESPLITLTGTVTYRDRPELGGTVRALGAIDHIEIDRDTGTLQARLAVDHVDLLEVVGTEAWLGGSTEDRLARTLRRHIQGRLPLIEIPVRLEQAIVFPSLTEGPVRLQGASMPLAAGVADVYAGDGVLWVAVRVEPGDVVKDGDAPPGADATPASGTTMP